MELLLQGRVVGAGVSNQDYLEVPEELRQQIVSLEDTISVPRQLVSVRRGLEPELVEKVVMLLSRLEETDAGQLILVNLKHTKKFDALPPESAASLTELKGLMDLLAD
jgi:hypothetical protein